jgi:hypothetical protein
MSLSVAALVGDVLAGLVLAGAWAKEVEVSKAKQALKNPILMNENMMASQKENAILL